MNKYHHPTVHLVGAGPGDPGLITLRGQSLLSDADVVLYDHLVAPELLLHCKATCEKIFVGKRVGKHTLSQDKINALIIEKANAYKQLVRLKGGDPYVFGRGAEEAQILKEAGITFEIVPGVTSGIAVPAYAGIPLTYRGIASDACFITGHEQSDRTTGGSIDWHALAKWRGTIVFYMGVTHIKNITSRLLDGGKDGETPAAIISWGCTPKQKTVVSTLKNIAADALTQHIRPPAIIIIGKVVNMRQTLCTFESRPMFGTSIVVTRATSQASSMVTKLMALGSRVYQCPTIKTTPAKNIKPLYDAIENISKYQWLIFTSSNGVNFFFDALAKCKYDSRYLGNLKIAAVGIATNNALKSYGIIADLVPRHFNAHNIIETLKSTTDLSNQNILTPRANLADNELPEGLAALGAHVDDITCYETEPDETNKSQIINHIENETVDWITFTSASTVNNFLKLVPHAIVNMHNIKIATIGPKTSQAVRDAKLKVTLEAKGQTIDQLIDDIMAYKP